MYLPRKPWKSPKLLTTFWSHILDILDKHENIQFALTWCPGHFDIEGNEQADSLAKSSSRMYHRNTDYKSLSYISSLSRPVPPDKEVGLERARLGPAARLGPQPPGVRLEPRIVHGGIIGEIQAKGRKFP